MFLKLVVGILLRILGGLSDPVLIYEIRVGVFSLEDLGLVCNYIVDFLAARRIRLYMCSTPFFNFLLHLLLLLL